MTDTISPSVMPLSREEIGAVYIALMQQVVIRLEAIKESAAEAVSQISHTSNWQNAKFCYLQIRRVCEYAAIAVLVAHGERVEFLSRSLLKEWNAGKLFQKLTSLNPNSFPIPVTTHVNAKGQGSHHLEIKERLLDGAAVTTIYNACGDRLHASSLRRILKGKLPDYSFDDIAAWANSLVRTLENHLILLPEISSVMLVALRDSDDGQVHCSFADADGPAAYIPENSTAKFSLVGKI